MLAHRGVTGQTCLSNKRSFCCKAISILCSWFFCACKILDTCKEDNSHAFIVVSEEPDTIEDPSGKYAQILQNYYVPRE